MMTAFTITTINSATITEPLASQLPKASQTEQPNTNAVETQTTSTSSTSSSAPPPPKQHADLTVRIGELEQEVSLLQTYNATQATTLADYQQQIVTLTAEKLQLSTSVNQLTTDLEVSTQKISQLEQDIQNLKTTNAYQDTLQLAVQNAAKTRMELEENTDTLLAKIDDLTSANTRALQNCQSYSSALLRIIENGITASCDPEIEVRKHLEQVVTTTDLSALLVVEAVSPTVTDILRPWVDTIISEHQKQKQQQQEELEELQQRQVELEELQQRQVELEELQQRQQQQLEAAQPEGLTLATSHFKVRDNVLFIADPTNTFYEAFNIGAPNYIVSNETLANCNLNPKKQSRFVGTIVAIDPQVASPRNPFKLPVNTPIFMCDAMLCT